MYHATFCLSVFHPPWGRTQLSSWFSSYQKAAHPSDCYSVIAKYRHVWAVTKRTVTVDRYCCICIFLLNNFNFHVIIKVNVCWPALATGTVKLLRLWWAVPSVARCSHQPCDWQETHRLQLRSAELPHAQHHDSSIKVTRFPSSGSSKGV